MLDWNAKYTIGAYASSKNPSRLDIACGEGRNAIFLAKNGYNVDAIDISDIAIERGKKTAEKDGIKTNFIQADIENYQIPAETYDLIVNFNYLQRTLIPAIKNGLKKNGVVLFETFTLEQQAIWPPKNPEFLLKPNELLKLFGDLHIFYYREGIFEEERRKAVASLAGGKI